jgi:hypothetical protein
MNLSELYQKLIAAARADAPGDRVPYAFEKRIMARLAAPPALDSLVLWSHALWRGAVSCVAIALLLGVCSFFMPGETTTVANGSSSATEELSQAFENTLLASVDQSFNSFEDVQ